MTKKPGPRSQAPKYWMNGPASRHTHPLWRKPGRSTSRGFWSWVRDERFPGARRERKRCSLARSEYIGTDIEPGMADVDLMADIHRLTEVTGRRDHSTSFGRKRDSSTSSEIAHLAAHQIMKALKVGGLLFVQTHQTFPIHGVP